jgi:hypothetical protein
VVPIDDRQIRLERVCGRPPSIPRFAPVLSQYACSCARAHDEGAGPLGTPARLSVSYRAKCEASCESQSCERAWEAEAGYVWVDPDRPKDYRVRPIAAR